MANRRDPPTRTDATNRLKAATAILEGWADGDIATVLTTAAAAGFVYGKITTYQTGGTVNDR